MLMIVTEQSKGGPSAPSRWTFAEDDREGGLLSLNSPMHEPYGMWVICMRAALVHVRIAYDMRGLNRERGPHAAARTITTSMPCHHPRCTSLETTVFN